MTVEVRTHLGWVPFDGHEPVAVRETDTIVFRGVAPGTVITVGFTDISAGDDGTASLRPATDTHLAGHVGLVDVAADGRRIGEIDLVPHKMSVDAYKVLRADLQRVWSGLVLDPAGLTATAAGPPAARELWRRIDRAVMGIVADPSTRMEVAVEPRRLERVRRLRELTPAVVAAGQRHRPALTRTLRRSTATPENAMCAATLRLLRAHARRDPTATDLVATLDRVLRHPVFVDDRSQLQRVTWGMRSDARYRQVLAVHQILNRPELEPTEGPGELRLGVPALARLYEYWVFLQILVAARERYGEPLGDGFAQLATPVLGNRHRLEIARGTTVTFPGPVHVAFEPEIDVSGTGWMGVEYVPHPDPAIAQNLATADVVVLDAHPGRAPSLIVFDAKYVGRAFVELEAAKTHTKYARMRVNGNPAVTNVTVVHPHTDLSVQWPGYGHQPFTPGNPVTVTLPAAGPRPVHVPERDPEPPAPQGPAGELLVVADPWWMGTVLGDRRIDLVELRDLVARSRPVSDCILVLPRLETLRGFAHAAQHVGWQIRWIDTPERAHQVEAIVATVNEWVPAPVTVVTGDPTLIAQLPDSAETFSDMGRVPDL